MARIVKCEMCGKEKQVGFLGALDYVRFGTHTLDMCDECYKTYGKWNKALLEIIEAKLINKKKLSEKATQEELAQLVRETQEHLDKNYSISLLTSFDNEYVNCFHTDGKGNFMAKEAPIDFANSDISLKDMAKRQEKGENCGGLMFTKDDISERILYSRPMTAATLNSAPGLVGQTYTIMLNDPTKLSVKPCFVKASVILTDYNGLALTANKVLDVLFEEDLSAFLKDIGCNATIERIKKFKKGAI